MSDKSIAQQCGVPDWSLNWIIDEFDSSFNTLAMASLRYHMDYAVTVCEGERREQYQAMLDEFEELRDRNTMSREYAEHSAGHRKGLFETAKTDCPECDHYRYDYFKAEEKHQADIQAARHKFIDLMPGLWS